MSYLIAFDISVLASVVSYYICKWLDEIVDSAAPGPTVWSTDNVQKALQKLRRLEGFATPCVVFLTAFARSTVV